MTTDVGGRTTKFGLPKLYSRFNIHIRYRKDIVKKEESSNDER